MQKRTELVFRGFLQLSSFERSELINAMDDYFEKDYQEKCRVQEAYKIKRIALGLQPQDTCPCCGR